MCHKLISLFLPSRMQAADLSKFCPGFFLLHPSMQDEVVKDLTAAGVLHDEVQSLFSFDDLKLLNY